MRKLKIALAVGLAVLVSLVAVAYFVNFRAAALGQRILDAAGADAGIDIRAGGFELNLVRGIVLEDVVATTAIPSGRVSTRVDRVVLEHRLLPLLLGDIIIDRLVLERPRIEVINEADGARIRPASRPTTPHGDRITPASRPPTPRNARISPVSRPMPPPGASALQRPRAPSSGETAEARSVVTRGVTVHAASIVDGTLLLRSGDDPPTTRIAGLDVELAGIALEEGATSVAVGLSGRGHIDIGEVWFRQRTATGNRAAIAAGGGIFTVRGLELTTSEGRLRMAELAVDLNADPYSYRTELSGDEIDLNLLFAIDGIDSLGPARIEMSAAGAGPETAAVAGSGTIWLGAGRIPQAEVLQQLASIVGLQLAGADYEATRIDFRIVDDRIDVAPFAIVSEAARVEASGRIAIDGLLDGRAKVSMRRQDIDLGSWGGDFSDAVVEALTDDSGWVSIPLLFDGPVQDPRVRPDSEALVAALQAAAGSSLGRLLQGIIKRDE